MAAPVAVKPITTEFGHSLPPEGPHTVSFHFPGWNTAIRFRDGDMSIFAQLKSIYPRFTPFGPARQLSAALGAKLGAVPGKDGVLMFLHPATFSAHRAHSLSHHRKDNKLAEGDLTFRVVDVHGVRLYCVVYALPKTPGAIGIWQNAGTGTSTRLAEFLVRYVGGSEEVEEDFAVVEWAGNVDDVPAPTYLPESEAHGQLRRRIRDLLHRAPLDPDKVKVDEGDVYLYQTGMAAIYRLHEALSRRDPAGTVLVLGSIFHNTFHLFEEAAGGMKHFGACDGASGVMDKVEAYLEAHYRDGKTVSYVFLEFPSNPLLVSADLKRLRQIADKYAFPVVIDDTVGSFANLDVLPVADCLVTSLTKSFSGYADVMAGSVVLNPLAPAYAALGPLLAALFRNELFAGDAAVLLANSDDYLARTPVLNRNAAALADCLARHAADDAGSPIRAVLYPTTSDTRANYDAFRRRPAPELPAPGYGCLLSVDFHTLGAAAAFYDAIPVHCGPHLGAHRTLALPFNALVLGKNPDDARYHAAYGARPEQVRISAGLEDEAELVAAVELALDKAADAYRTGAGVEGAAGQAIPGADGKAKSEADVKVAAEETSANFE